MPCSSPRNDTRFKYASKICALLQLSSMACAVRIWSHFWRRLRPPEDACKSASSWPASCMVMVEAPRAFLENRLSQAAVASADTSTPPWCMKRWSSASSTACCTAGEMSASGTHGKRRTFMSTRNDCKGAPLRSSNCASELR